MISGYINSVPFPVYLCGEFVVQSEKEYYIRWWPSYISSGTFTIGGRTFNFSDYSSGYFSNFNGEITSGAFSSNLDITGIETNASRVLLGAFYNMHYLSFANLSECETVGYSAFVNCFGLAQVSLPKCKVISSSAFQSCSSLSQISLPECETINNLAFRSCLELNNIYLPKCEYIGSWVFGHCALNRIELPKCSYIAFAAFAYCSSLSQVSIPECRILDTGAFGACSALRSIILPVCSSIGLTCFDRCQNLSTLVLLSSSVVSVGSLFIRHTPFTESNIGSIYVPSSLVEAYKTAEGWSDYSRFILPYEGD